MFYELPYLLEEEEEYSPPEDEQARKFSFLYDVTFTLIPVLSLFSHVTRVDQSTFDLGMDHLLNKMPRAQALDSIRAFSGLR